MVFCFSANPEVVIIIFNEIRVHAGKWYTYGCLIVFLWDFFGKGKSEQ